VIERSMEVPVLLDCWAPWCGPCKSLKPVLEKLVQAYGGQFVLAKLNSDECPGVAQALQLRSIPHVFLLKDGQVVDQFTGALPESQVRAFLDKHVKPQVSPVDQLREQAAADPEQAEALLRQALALQPGHVEVTLDLADRVIARGALDDALALLERVAAGSRNDRHAALLKRIELARNRPRGPARSGRRIAANAKTSTPLRAGRDSCLRRRLQRRFRPVAGGGAARQGRLAREGARAAGRVVRRLR
jgi:putative thioredoxin